MVLAQVSGSATGQTGRLPDQDGDHEDEGQ
jgi:hypothetical protein